MTVIVHKPHPFQSVFQQPQSFSSLVGTYKAVFLLYSIVHTLCPCFLVEICSYYNFMQRSVESDEEDENSFSKEPEGMCYCIDQVKALTEF